MKPRFDVATTYWKSGFMAYSGTAGALDRLKLTGNALRVVRVVLMVRSGRARWSCSGTDDYVAVR
jgi:hypothetical protein